MDLSPLNQQLYDLVMRANFTQPWDVNLDMRTLYHSQFKDLLAQQADPNMIKDPSLKTLLDQVSITIQPVWVELFLSYGATPTNYAISYILNRWGFLDDTMYIQSSQMNPLHVQQAVPLRNETIKLLIRSGSRVSDHARAKLKKRHAHLYDQVSAWEDCAVLKQSIRPQLDLASDQEPRAF